MTHAIGRIGEGGVAAVGIDIGSTSVKTVALDARGQVQARASRPLVGEQRATVLEAVADLGLPPDLRTAFGVTGQGRLLLADLPGVVADNEVLALLAGAGAIGSRARSIIEIGGQISRWLQIEPAEPGLMPTLVAFALNDQCAAGAGAFLTQQAGRLQMGIAEFAAAAAAAPTGASIAGRCAVFAKSDMIHLQQKGVGVREIAYGLCLALARNFIGTVLRGREARPPVAFAGGGALNAGLVRAFGELLGADEVSVLPDPVYVGALGAASLAARRGARLPLATLVERLRPSVAAVARADSGRLKVESEPTGDHPAYAFDDGKPVVEAFLGVDLGSVSTDFVVLRPDGELLHGIYLPTRGRPIEVLGEGLAMLRERYGARLRVLGLGTTGSGRHLAAKLLGADLVQNEITAQLRGALHYFPDVDSIFEIGGQDSKYVRVERGQVADFTMNKVCAAGTGSFLEEQCENLGIDVKTAFAPLAKRSAAPAELGARCTVFMETELVNARSAGANLADLTAGLALAVARNYLQKVVAHRRVGKNVVFQGGVANNAAVRRAFEQLLGRRVLVHPHAGLSGAIGVALLTRAALAVARTHPGHGRAGEQATKFKGLEAIGPGYETRTFECKHCENRCAVAIVHVGDTKAHFGDTCERYTVRDAGRDPDAPSVPDLFAEREALLRGYVDEEVAGDSRRTVGLPRASIMFEYLPFWATLLRELGFSVRLSPQSNSRTLELGNRHLPAETCLPIKMVFGHVAALRDAGVDHILVPSVVTLDDPTRKTGQVCPFTSAVPFMARAAIDASIVTPALVLGKEFRHFAEEMTPALEELGVPPARLRAAWEQAMAAQTAFREALRVRGESLLAGDFERALVVAGRPYNLFDPYLNLNLGRHLQRLGVLALPQGFLPAEGMDLTDRGERLPWRFPRDAMRAAVYSLSDPRLHTLFVTNFGCGPDSFVQKYLTDALSDRPPLVLEFDEHRGEAGMVTRIEAYLDQIKEQPPARPRRPVRMPQPPARLDQGPFYIPYFADHAYAFEGALRFIGAQAEVLPPPDAESIALGEASTTGKECHAYAMVAGDMLRFAARRDPAQPATFLFPSTNAPCLLTQWGEGYRMTLAERGHTHVRVLDTGGGKATLDLFGMRGVTPLWRGLVATDLMVAWLCEHRPYEVRPGAADEVHATNLRDLSDSLAADDMPGFIGRACERMTSVEVDRSVPRPLVGVAGDIYTRINSAANLQLFRTLETMGCEVWPAPFLVDAMDFSFANSIVRTWREKVYHEAVAAFALTLRKDLESWRVRRKLSTQLTHAGEPSYRELIRLTAPYVGRRSVEMLILDVGKIAHFAGNGADGIVHAICLNCMLGTAAAGLLGRMRKDYGVPTVSLVYAAGETPALRTKLEAFVHQVHEHHRDRKAAAPPADKERPSFTRRWLFGG
jgi:predicted CoA-substrate-specific enzyme activase